MKKYDVIILGAGASGLMAAIQLNKRNKSTMIIDMGDNPARKIAVSGGGKCNFTNTHADYTHYFGQNPRFVSSALAQFSPTDTVNWVKSHNIASYEKEPGRYFCKDSANQIVNALMSDIKSTPVKCNTKIKDVEKDKNCFIVKTDNGEFLAKSIIVASGGLSYPHLGVSNIGHIIAKKFGHKIEPVRPALCAIKTNIFGSDLAGISLPVTITIGKHKIDDDLLFTHFGIGGPACYRASIFSSDKFTINFAPNLNVFEKLKSAKQTNGKKSLTNTVSEFLPNKLARFLCKNDEHNIADCKDSKILTIANRIQNFEIENAKPIGLQSAEVTFGGVSCDKISSKTMESQICDGLFFAGEVIDITGDLGGYNIQWAFSSGFVAGNNA